MGPAISSGTSSCPQGLESSLSVKKGDWPFFFPEGYLFQGCSGKVAEDARLLPFPRKCGRTVCLLAFRILYLWFSCPVHFSVMFCINGNGIKNNYFQEFYIWYLGGLQTISFWTAYLPTSFNSLSCYSHLTFLLGR